VKFPVQEDGAGGENSGDPRLMLTARLGGTGGRLGPGLQVPTWSRKTHWESRLATAPRANPCCSTRMRRVGPTGRHASLNPHQPSEMPHQYDNDPLMNGDHDFHICSHATVLQLQRMRHVMTNSLKQLATLTLTKVLKRQKSSLYPRNTVLA
jgi:hypothetical protein